MSGGCRDGTAAHADLTLRPPKHSDAKYGRRNAQGPPGPDRARCTVGRPGARLRGDRRNQTQERPGVRSPGGNDLPCIASSRTSGAACQSLGNGRNRATASGLCIDPTRRARSYRSPQGLAAVFRRYWWSPRRNPATREAGVISDYLESLVHALNFDRSLSRRVREEVEVHLREAVATDPRCAGPEAERRAISNFGDPQLIAAQFAVVSLAKRTRGVGNAVILVIASVFITMKARVAWFAVMQCAIGDDIRAVSGIVGSIDRYAFWLSVISGIGVGRTSAAAAFPRSSGPNIVRSFVVSIGSALQRRARSSYR
jgi:hypothetical protein